MAARKQLWHPDAIREKIRIAQLVNRLEDHAFGDLEMTKTQIAAARILVDKCIPSLSSTQMTGKDEGPVQFENVTEEARLEAFMAFMAKTKRP